MKFIGEELLEIGDCFRRTILLILRVIGLKVNGGIGFFSASVICWRRACLRGVGVRLELLEVKVRMVHGVIISSCTCSSVLWHELRCIYFLFRSCSLSKLVSTTGQCFCRHFIGLRRLDIFRTTFITAN